jgi:pyridoxine 5-phosphate synthase
MAARLHINIDHVATIRKARGTKYPDPVHAAALVELAGADGITIHLREDRRHMQDRDLRLLRDTVGLTLNLEMAATQEMVRIAYEIKPDLVTLVPERREERTTEGGLDLNVQRETIQRTVDVLRDAEIRVSLFVDPDLDQIRTAHKIRAEQIELCTGFYCEARGAKQRAAEVSKVIDAAKTASRLGLVVAAGHGLNYQNTAAIAQIAEIEEFNIGHAVIARAILVGMDRAVREMVEIVRAAGAHA